MTLTLGIITFNDSKRLQNTLTQLNFGIDEIIIIDRDSIDDTVSIARQFGAKVYSVNNNTNLADCKNLVIDKATSRYILFMDAGELLENINILSTEDLYEDTYTVMCQQYSNDKTLNYIYRDIRIVKTASLMQYIIDIQGYAVVRDTYSKLLNVCIICNSK